MTPSGILKKLTSIIESIFLDVFSEANRLHIPISLYKLNSLAENHLSNCKSEYPHGYQIAVI